MKKIIVMIFSIIFILSSTILTYADNEDCRNISQMQKDLVGVDNSYSLMRIYNGSFMHGFAICDSLENLTSNKYVIEEVFVTYQNENRDNVACYKVRNSVADRINGLDSAAGVFAEYTNESIIAKLENKTKSIINSIICLCGETSHDGIYLYYRTDKGDFILFKEYATSDIVYFFPLEEFNIVAAKYIEEKTNALYDENGEVRKGASFSFKDITNVSKYELSLDTNTDLSIIAVSVAICLVVITFMLILIIRKSRNSKRQGTVRNH